MEKERLWKVSEVADYLGWHRDTVYKKIKRYRETGGRVGLRYEKVGIRGIRVPESAVLAQVKEAV